MADETDEASDMHKVVDVDPDNSKDNTPGGKTKVATKREKVVPHYLRASTGSCHDACKYGKPHVFKDKPWKPKNRRVSAPSLDSEKPAEIQIFVDKKVKVILQAEKPDSSFPPDDEIKKHIPSSKKSLEPSLPRDSPRVDEIKEHIPSTRKSFEAKTSKSPEPNLSRVVTQEAKKIQRSPTLEPPKTAKMVVPSSGNFSSPDIVKPASTAKMDVLSERSSSNPKRSASVGPLKSKISPMMLSSSVDSSIGKRGSKTANVNIPSASRVSVRKNTPLPTVLSSKKTPKGEVKRILNSSIIGPSRKSPAPNPGGANLRKNKTLNLKSQMGTGKVESENVEEKTLHMIETEEDCLSSAAQNGSPFIRSPSSLSPESLNSSSQATSKSFETDDEEDHSSEYTDSEVDNLKKQNGKVSVKKDTDPSSTKLKFRRGKTVEPQPETNATRRLRFRQGKTREVNPDTNGTPRRRSYRKRETNSGKKETEKGSVKVVLKHQEIETKKDAQVSLNNVIEETASKLVQARKSKVKALVGAFESVISLQEGNPSSSSSAVNNR